MDELHQHEAQAAALKAAYVAAMTMESDGMLYWVAVAAKELRLGAERKLVHIGASGDMDQSTVYRFERHEGQPESIDATVAAYADDLDLRPIEIWQHALKLWSEAEATSGAGDSPGIVAGAVAPLQEVAESKKPPARARRQNPSAGKRRSGA